MPMNPEIYRSAGVLIEHYGARAKAEALQLANGMFVRGDLDGQRVWLAIAKVVDELQDERLEQVAR